MSPILELNLFLFLFMVLGILLGTWGAGEPVEEAWKTISKWVPPFQAIFFILTALWYGLARGSFPL